MYPRSDEFLQPHTEHNAYKHTENLQTRLTKARPNRIKERERLMPIDFKDFMKALQHIAYLFTLGIPILYGIAYIRCRGVTKETDMDGGKGNRLNATFSRLVTAWILICLVLAYLASQGRGI